MKISDKRFASAEQFMSGYFNQDWRPTLKAAHRPQTVDGAIAFAIEQYPIEALRRVVISFKQILQENPTEEELYDFFVKQGGLGYDPTYAGGTIREFTQYILDALQRSPKLSTKS